ncbi:MAG: helix-turn-helix domain-containing protein [Acetobacterium sp.]
MEKLTYNVQEIAELIGISLPKAYELTRRRDFPAIRFSRRIVIPKVEFREWLGAEARGEHEQLSEHS